MAPPCQDGGSRGNVSSRSDALMELTRLDRVASRQTKIPTHWGLRHRKPGCRCSRLSQPATAAMGIRLSVRRFVLAERLGRRSFHRMGLHVGEVSARDEVIRRFGRQRPRGVPIPGNAGVPSQKSRRPSCLGDLLTSRLLRASQHGRPCGDCGWPRDSGMRCPWDVLNQVSRVVLGSRDGDSIIGSDGHKSLFFLGFVLSCGSRSVIDESAFLGQLITMLLVRSNSGNSTAPMAPTERGSR